jgi:Domain of unknown function (DUF397)
MDGEIGRARSRSSPRTQWRRSTFSDSGTCVEVAPLADGGASVRDSKDPDGPLLRFTPAEWAAFDRGVKAGEFG